MIASKISQIRKIRKITEKELSAEIGMSMTGFRQAMANDDFKVSTLINIAKVLNVDIAYLVKPETQANYPDNKLVNEKTVPYGSCDGCNQREELLRQKDEIISDLKYMIESLKLSLEQKDKIIESILK